MRGHGHFKFEQYKLWCKNHHKKASEYINFKVFIELYGDVYTLEYVYDFYGNVITNKNSSALITRVKHSVNTIEEFDFWKDNNFNNPVYMSR